MLLIFAYNSSTKQRGIWLNSCKTGVSSQFNIDRNTINHSGYSTGIHVLACTGARLYKNNVYISNPAMETNGIQVDGGTNNVLSFNIVKGTDASSLSNVNTTAISAINSYGILFCCDSVIHTFTGIKIDGYCKSPDNFRGNKFNSHFLGLNLTSSAVLGSQLNRGNKWYGDYSGTNAKMAKDDGGINQSGLSIFIIHTNTLPFLPPDLLLEPNGQDWFQFIESNNFYQCGGNELCPEVSATATPDEIDLSIANGEFQVAAYKEGITWTARQQLFSKLSQYPGLMANNSVLHTFFNDASEKSLGKFNKVSEDIENMYALDSVSNVQLDEYTTQIQNDLQLLWETDSLLYLADSNDSLALLSQKSTAYNDLINVYPTANAFWASIELNRYNQASGIADYNMAVSAMDIRDANLQSVNDLMLTRIAHNDLQFKASEEALLESIGSQCPLDGGNAVFTARGLLEWIEDAIYSDQDICNDQQLRSNHVGDSALTSKKQPSHSGFAIYPNPAKQNITLSYEQGLEDAYFTLTNILGETVLTTSLTEKSESRDIDLSYLPKGVYVCSIRVKERIIFFQKLIKN